MKFAKLLVAIVALVAALILASMLIGVVMNIVWYLFVFAVVGALGYAGYKLFAPQKKSKQLDSKNDLLFEDNEFERADRLLDEYKKRLTLKQ